MSALDHYLSKSTAIAYSVEESRILWEQAKAELAALRAVEEAARAIRGGISGDFASVFPLLVIRFEEALAALDKDRKPT